MERPNRSRIFETILREEPGLRSSPSPPPPASPPAPGVPSAPLTEFHVACQRGRRAEDHGDDETAVAEYERALRAADSPNVTDPERILLSLAHGRCHQRRRHYAEARMAFQLAQHMVHSSPSPASLQSEQVEIDAHFGALEFALGQIEKAQGHLVSAIDRYEDRGQVDPKRLSRLYVALASVHTEASLLDEAMEVALKGLTFLEDCADPVDPEKMRMFQLLATIAHKKDEWEATVRHLLEAYRYADLAASQRDLIELEVLLATVYAQYGRDAEACEWYEAAIRRLEVTGEQAEWPLSLLYVCLAQLQAKLHSGQAGASFNRSLDLQLSQLYLRPEA